MENSPSAEDYYPLSFILPQEVLYYGEHEGHCVNAWCH
jgi:hypothetical protein